jgi:hypothetical protein
MPEEAPVPPKRRLRAPSARRFAAGALACFVAVFGVLALRVHGGDDPALARAVKAKAKVSTSSTSSSSSSSSESDPYDSSGSSSGSGDSGSDDSGVTATPGASTSAS